MTNSYATHQHSVSLNKSVPSPNLASLGTYTPPHSPQHSYSSPSTWRPPPQPALPLTPPHQGDSPRHYEQPRSVEQRRTHSEPNNGAGRRQEVKRYRPNLDDSISPTHAKKASWVKTLFGGGPSQPKPTRQPKMKLSKAEFAVKAAMASMEEQRKQERERQAGRGHATESSARRPEQTQTYQAEARHAQSASAPVARTASQPAYPTYSPASHRYSQPPHAALLLDPSKPRSDALQARAIPYAATNKPAASAGAPASQSSYTVYGGMAREDSATLPYDRPHRAPERRLSPQPAPVERGGLAADEERESLELERQESGALGRDLFSPVVTEERPTSEYRRSTRPSNSTLGRPGGYHAGRPRSPAPPVVTHQPQLSAPAALPQPAQAPVSQAQRQPPPPVPFSPQAAAFTSPRPSPGPPLAAIFPHQSRPSEPAPRPIGPRVATAAPPTQQQQSRGREADALESIMQQQRLREEQPRDAVHQHHASAPLMHQQRSSEAYMGDTGHSRLPSAPIPEQRQPKRGPDSRPPATPRPTTSPSDSRSSLMPPNERYSYLAPTGQSVDESASAAAASWEHRRGQSSTDNYVRQKRTSSLSPAMRQSAIFAQGSSAPSPNTSSQQAPPPPVPMHPSLHQPTGPSILQQGPSTLPPPQTRVHKLSNESDKRKSIHFPGTQLNDRPAIPIAPTPAAAPVKEEVSFASLSSYHPPQPSRLDGISLRDIEGPEKVPEGMVLVPKGVSRIVGSMRRKGSYRRTVQGPGTRWKRRSTLASNDKRRSMMSIDGGTAGDDWAI